MDDKNLLSSFINAIINDDNKTVKEILKDPYIDIYSIINYKDSTNKYPITYAIINKNLEIIDLLLSYEELDVNVKFGNQLLSIYAIQTDLNLAYKLIKHPNISFHVYGYDSLIDLAIKTNDIDFIREIFKFYTINNSTLFEENIITAIKGKNFDVIKIINELTNKLSSDINDKVTKKLLKYIVNSDNIEIVNYFIEHGSNFKINKNNILEYSIKEQRDSIINYLIDDPSININTYSDSGNLLVYSMKDNKYELFYKLLNHRNIIIDFFDDLSEIYEYVPLDMFIALIEKYKTINNINIKIANILLIKVLQNNRLDLLNYLFIDKDIYNKIDIYYSLNKNQENILKYCNLSTLRYLFEKLTIVESEESLKSFKNTERSKIININLVDVYSLLEVSLYTNYKNFNYLLSYSEISLPRSVIKSRIIKNDENDENKKLINDFYELLSLVKLDF